METIYEKPGFLTIYYNSQRNYIIVKSFKMNTLLLDIQEVCTIILKTIQEKKCPYMIVDSHESTGELSQAVTNWIATEWIPNFKTHDVKAIATVVPQAISAIYSTIDWQTNDYGEIAMKNVQTFEEADAFIESIHKNLGALV